MELRLIHIHVDSVRRRSGRAVCIDIFQFAFGHRVQVRAVVDGQILPSAIALERGPRWLVRTAVNELSLRSDRLEQVAVARIHVPKEVKREQRAIVPVGGPERARQPLS